MSISRIVESLLSLCFAGAMLGPLPVLAQEFPARAVRLIVPFPAGGSGDMTARVVGQKLAEIWNQPVLVENRPGGNTIIAADVVARAPADGYTLLVALDATLTMNQSLYSKLPYRPEDFVPVTLLVEQPLLITVGAKMPETRTWKDLVYHARAQPGKINFAVGAIVTQVTAELIKSAAGINVTLVPYQGSPPTLNAVLGGQVDVAMSDIGPFAGAVRDGKLRGLAVTGPKRTPALPDVPTLQEVGVSGVAVTSWFGLAAPPGTPAGVIAKLNADVRRVLQMPDVRERLLTVGLEASPTTPQELTARIQKESQQWERVIRAAGIKLD